MGAVPIAYASIGDLSSIRCEEIDMGEGAGCKFLPTENKEYPNLSPEDQSVMDDIIQRFGNTPKAEIVEIMRGKKRHLKNASPDMPLVVSQKKTRHKKRGNPGKQSFLDYPTAGHYADTQEGVMPRKRYGIAYLS